MNLFLITRASFLQLVLLLASWSAYGQHEANDALHTAADPKTIFQFVSQGQLNGHIRNYFMATVNEGPLRDYWTNASGGTLNYHTASWKGWRIGVQGIFTYNVFGSDLNDKDTLVDKGAKWEKELYDVTRPFEKHDLDRLEELYIEYRWNSSFCRIGKIDINRGPLLLRRDGRMKPFVFRGAWTEFDMGENQRWYIGLIEGVSPRGMTEWYTINEAIGISNNGFQYDGAVADYHEAARSLGFVVAGTKLQMMEGFKAELWNYYFHRLMNISWVQLDYQKNDWFIGAQYVHQFADPHQEQLEISERYYHPDEQANVISTRIGKALGHQGFRLSAAYLHAFDTGRFLFPKELGRENFYVSQPRSWIDGYGDVDVYEIRLALKPQQARRGRLTGDIRLSRVEAPSPDNFAMNKYAKNSYYQSTLMLDYKCGGVFEGLRLTFLYVGRLTEASANLTWEETFYNTNFHHINVIANIEF